MKCNLLGNLLSYDWRGSQFHKSQKFYAALLKTITLSDVLTGEWGGGLLPYMGSVGMCVRKGHGFSAVLGINRASIWPFWSLIGYGFCTPVLNWVCFLEQATFFIIIDKIINKSPSKVMFMANLSAAMVTNRVFLNRAGKIPDHGLK